VNRNAIDFTERMEAGKAGAMNRRNRGQPTGKPAPGWNRKRAGVYATTDPASWEWLCSEARREWRRDVRQAVNDFQAACLSGPHDDPRTWQF
jgi:hypothetical protein